MKAVRIHDFGDVPRVEDAPRPDIAGRARGKIVATLS